MAIWNRQPKRSVPEPVKPPQHGAPNPLRENFDELDHFRWRIIWITVVILSLCAAGYAIYGPWFAVRTITVRGTREINPASVKTVTEQYLSEWRYSIIPNRNLWLLSRTHLSQTLVNKIRERISVEEVQVMKRNRHDLEIVVIERTPLAVWKSGDQQGSIDRTGTIINYVSETAGQPIIINEAAKEFLIGEQVLTEPVMAGWKTLNDALTASTLEVENYVIPIPTCPTTIITPEEQREANRNSNESINVNSFTNSSNRNTSENTNERDDQETNDNANGNGNTNTIQPIVVQTDCDTAALAKSSQEIHLKLKNGPVVLFDRHQDLVLAVQTVKRLITNPDNSGATYIDIRFQERVYIK